MTGRQKPSHNPVLLIKRFLENFRNRREGGHEGFETGALELHPVVGGEHYNESACASGMSKKQMADLLFSRLEDMGYESGPIAHDTGSGKPINPSSIFQPCKCVMKDVGYLFRLALGAPMPVIQIKVC